ncbi:hypothetical protein [Roseovarius sp. D22-M7]|uniref:hypothetical protein n=1 Tax=Roseovarius sp. D22-M7 TaxID=3127116 RepID=UPI00300FF2AA
MTNKTIPTMALAALAAAAFSAAPADASSIPGISVEPAPEVAGPFDMVNFFGFFGSGDASAPTASTPVDGTLSVVITGDIADDLSFTSGALGMTDDSGAWLSGTLAHVSTVSDPDGDDIVEMLFDTLGGPAETEFGTFAVATLTGEFGASPFAPTSLLSTSGVTGSFSIKSANPTPIPLPAGLPLLLGGFGLLWLVRNGFPMRK